MTAAPPSPPPVDTTVAAYGTAHSSRGPEADEGHLADALCSLSATRVVDSTNRAEIYFPHSSVLPCAPTHPFTHHTQLIFALLSATKLYMSFVIVLCGSHPKYRHGKARVEDPLGKRPKVSVVRKPGENSQQPGTTFLSSTQ